MMIFLLLLLIIFIVITKIIYSNYSAKQLLELTKDDELDNITKQLPSNIEMCKQILNKIGNENVKIDFSVDEKSTTSYYNVQTNKIILANSELANKTFARTMFISHECWHSNQKKSFLWCNFILANINLIYLIATIFLSIFNVINKEQYIFMLLIYILLNMLGFFARVVIETDATYMAYITSKEYLEEKLEQKNSEKIIDRYKEILFKGTSCFLFSLITNNLVMILCYIFIGILKGW